MPREPLLRGTLVTTEAMEEMVMEVTMKMAMEMEITEPHHPMVHLVLKY